MTLTVAWVHILRIPRLFISRRILGHDIGGSLAILYCQHRIPCVNGFLGSKCLQHNRHLVKAKYGEIVAFLLISLRIAIIFAVFIAIKKASVSLSFLTVSRVDGFSILVARKASFVQSGLQLDICEGADAQTVEGGLG